MSIPNAQQSLRLAFEATNMAQRLGHLYAGRVSLNAAIKAALTDAVEEDAGQEQLPLAAPALPGPTHTVAADGLVVTPSDRGADEDDLGPGQRVPEGTPTISEANAKKLHRHGRGRATIDDELPTEDELEAQLAAAEEVAEPDWATV